ncbi:hypothetical protein JCM21900_003962 [Sporobolomyces salmonicolor]
MGSHSRSHDKDRRDQDKKHHRSVDSADRDSKRHRSSRDEDRHKSSSHTGSSHRHRPPSSSSKRRAPEEDEEDDEWVEKDAPPPAPAAPSAPVDTVGTFSVGSMPTVAGLRRTEGENMTDGYGEGDVGGSSSRGGGMFGLGEGGEGGQGEMDFFGGFGTERKRREPKEKVDPSQMMGQSSRELNKAYWQGAPTTTSSSVPSLLPSAAAPAPSSGSPAPGSSGSAWRMTKLRRTFEAADEEGRPLEEVAVERYGSLQAFEEAREEKRVLDERDSRRRGRRESGYRAGAGGPSTPVGMGADGGGRKFVFTEMGGVGSPVGTPDHSRPPSRNAFRRPGEAAPTLGRSASASSLASPRPSTPVPSVFTPPVSRTPLVRSNLSHTTVLAPDPTSTGPSASSTSKPVLSQSELNKLQARVLKAKLLGADSADALEAEYEAERKRAEEAGPIVAAGEGMAGPAGLGGANEVQVLPTLDGRGRMYDTGIGTALADQQEGERKAKGGRGKKEKVFQSHDPKTGEVLRHAADDDALSLADLVRQERFSGGAGDQRQLDLDVANRIATDHRYHNDLDYVDEQAERLARAKMKSESMKRQFAINDYARTKKALDSCTLCPTDTGGPPKSAVVALGTRAYLSLTETEELVPGHCRIVPVQHCLSCLEVDEEEGWEEIKNFMKTLMQMFAEEDKGVVFFETITSHKYQKHSFIEAIPLPFELFDQIPIYFQEAIATSESEWSQHQKLISFTPQRPFRRALVPNLPYFMVQFDYRGEKGFGHIIEGVDDAPERDLDGEERRGELGEKGGGEFPNYFAHEIIGNLLDLEPRRWRKPRRLDRRDNAKRAEAFRKGYERWDWTKMLRDGGREEA